MIYAIIITILVIVLVVLFINKISQLIRNQEKAKIVYTDNINDIKRSTVIFFSNNDLIGTGILVSTAENDFRQYLILTARHVFTAATACGIHENIFRIAIASEREDYWKIISIPVNGAKWFDGGIDIDLVALDITHLYEKLRRKGCKPKFMDNFSESKNDDAIVAFCPDVYRNLSAEIENGYIKNPLYVLNGKITTMSRQCEIKGSMRIFDEVDLDNFIKPGHSGSPVFHVHFNDSRTDFTIAYIGNIVLSIDNGVYAGLSSVKPLFDMMRKASKL